MESKSQSNTDSTTPTVSSDFSEAETSRTSSTSRLSWKAGIANHLRKSGPAIPEKSQDIKEIPESTGAASQHVVMEGRTPGTITVAPRRGSKDTTNSSPVDPAYEPMPQMLHMPPIAVTGPDEPRSFLDLDDSSDEESVIQRAHSVRVGKPTVVENDSAYASMSPKIRNAGSTASSTNEPSTDTTGPSISKIKQMLGHEVKDLYDLTPLATPAESQAGLNGPAAALRALNGDDEFVEANIPAGLGAQDALRALRENTDRSSTTALPPTPKAQQEKHTDETKETVIEMPDTADRRQATETLPTPMGGFGALRMSRQVAPQESVRGTLDGLRSNPPTPASTADVHRANTAPSRPRSTSTKKVTIRPSDLVITSPSGSNKFRETVVTTPYPKHMESFRSSTAHVSTAKVASKRSIRLVNWKPKVPELPATTDTEKSTPMTDRFPSPKRDEILVLDLNLASHPSASILVEITLPAEASTTHPFDDADLFKGIRNSYTSSLLGVKRRIFSPLRSLSHVTVSDPLVPFDSTLFIKHLNNPRLGHKRKTWLLWLRDEQPVIRTSTSTPVNTGVFTTDSKRMSTESYYSPASLPRMPFLKHDSQTRLPKVTLHYEFNVAMILSSLALVVLLSMLSTVLWVLFGFPGAKAGQLARDIRGEGAGYGFENGWKGDAEARVLTGFVLGLFVLLLGGIVEGAWVLAAWVLL